MIKLDGIQFAEITDSFKNVTVKALETRLQQESDRKRKRSIEFMLTPRGIDRMYTSLKRLKYQIYSTVKSPDGDLYFMAKTKDLELEINDDMYNVGPYFVAIPIKGFLSRQVNPVHMFPAYKPKTRLRHLHHTAGIEEYEIKHPLTVPGSTCWGTVGSAYSAAVYDASIVDMFRVLYIFLTRLDWRSPLCSAWKWEAMEYGERL